MTAKTLYRIFGSIVGLFALILQYYLMIDKATVDGVDYVTASIRYFSFMTIWSNIIVTITFLIPLLSPQSKAGRFFQKPTVEAAVALYIFVVMLVYHFFLAHIWDPQGWQKVADVTLHYAVPIIYLIYWSIFSTKENIGYKYAGVWLLYPAIYVVYCILRGAVTNEYPYPFADAYKLGYPTALRNMVFVLLAYFIIGLIVIAVARFLTKKKNFH